MNEIHQGVSKIRGLTNFNAKLSACVQGCDWKTTNGTNKRTNVCMNERTNVKAKTIYPHILHMLGVCKATTFGHGCWHQSDCKGSSCTSCIGVLKIKNLIWRLTLHPNTVWCFIHTFLWSRAPQPFETDILHVPVEHTNKFSEWRVMTIVRWNVSKC